MKRSREIGKDEEAVLFPYWANDCESSGEDHYHRRKTRRVRSRRRSGFLRKQAQRNQMR